MSIDKQILEQLRRQFEKILRATCPEVRQKIIDRTRKGQGLNGPLKGLAPSTIKYRQRYASNLSSGTTPNRSNMTATGQHLDALRCTVSGDKYIFTFRESRGRTLAGGKDKSKNSDILEAQEKAGREWLGLTSREVEFVARQITKQLKFR